jgi:hypothetical protein
MKPVQVYLDDHVARQLDTFARQRGWTKSETIRVAVSALTSQQQDDPLLKLSGMVRNLPEDLSSHVDRYLAETFDAQTQKSQAGARGRPRARRR